MSASSPGSPKPPGTGRALLAYNFWRLLLLAACLGIGMLIGLPGLWLVVSSLLVSGVLSYFLLARQRIAMGVAVETSVNRSRDRFSRTVDEDAYVDAMLDAEKATESQPR